MKKFDKLARQLKAIIQKACRCLQTAKTDLEDGDSDSASSRAYYAAFHAMQAALLAKNLSFSKHSAVISAFNQHFVKAGIFPKEFSKNIERLFRERQIGDYDYNLSIEEKDAEEDIRLAQRLVEAVKEYLKKELT